MRTFTCRLLFAISLIAVLALAEPAQADQITFQSTISSAAPGDPNFCPLCTPGNTPGLLYSNPMGGPFVLATQGFNFGGSTQGVPPGAGITSPELVIVDDPSKCPTTLMTPCVTNGTRYLATAEPFAILRMAPGGNFALTSFQASQLFGPAGCPVCADPGESLLNAIAIQVTGFNVFTQLVQQTFVLTSAFQTFTPSGAAWMNVNRVVFAPLNAGGNVSIAAFAVDNVNVTVPEPTSLALLGAGIAALAARRAARRRSR